MALLQIDTVRDIWLTAPEWKPAFEGFFTIKVQPVHPAMQCLLPPEAAAEISEHQVNHQG